MNEIRNFIINLAVIVIILSVGFGSGYLFANKRANDSIANERNKYSESKQQFEARIIEYQNRIEEFGRQQQSTIAIISSGTYTMAGYSDIIGTETGRIFKVLNEVRGADKVLANDGNS